MLLAVSVLANVFESGIYKVSSLFLGFIILAIPVMIMEEKRALRANITTSYGLLSALLSLWAFPL